MSFSYAWCPSHASLTGTATSALVKEITQILGMHDFFYSKGNQHYAKYHVLTVEKMEPCLMRKLKRENNWCITYLAKLLCFSFCKMTVQWFTNFFLQKLGNRSLENMLPNSQMRSVRNQSSHSSVLWVVIATVPFGIGINNYVLMSVKLFIFVPHALC